MRWGQPNKKANSMLKNLWPGSWDQDNLLEKKLKNQHDLTRVKMLKYTPLVMRPRYPHKKINQNRLWSSIHNRPNLNDKIGKIFN
jgi:hypothetical protein